MRSARPALVGHAGSPARFSTDLMSRTGSAPATAPTSRSPAPRGPVVRPARSATKPAVIGMAGERPKQPERPRRPHRVEPWRIGLPQPRLDDARGGQRCHHHHHASQQQPVGPRDGARVVPSPRESAATHAPTRRPPRRSRTRASPDANARSPSRRSARPD